MTPGASPAPSSCAGISSPRPCWSWAPWCTRFRALAGSPVDGVGQLGPQQVAYLNGGDQPAVWTALGGLRHDEWVTRALEQLREELQQRGLAPARRAALRRGPVLIGALFALGVIRAFVGLSNGRPTGFLLLALIPLPPLGAEEAS